MRLIYDKKVIVARTRFDWSKFIECKKVLYIQKKLLLYFEKNNALELGYSSCALDLHYRYYKVLKGRVLKNKMSSLKVY